MSCSNYTTNLNLWMCLILIMSTTSGIRGDMDAGTNNITVVMNSGESVQMNTNASVQLTDGLIDNADYSNITTERFSLDSYSSAQTAGWSNSTGNWNTTIITTTMATPVEDKHSINFYIGLLLAVLSSLFIGTSFIFKKKGLLNLSVRAGQGGYGYLREGAWWAGMILMAIGECANFTAYAFAPASLVTPLGALSVLVTAVLSSHILKENLNLIGKVGCMICLLGATVVVIHAPREEELGSMQELGRKLMDVSFIAYTVIIVLFCSLLIFYFSPRYGQSNPLVYITITGAIGSLSVMACKGLGVAIKQTFGAGEQQFTNPLTWFIIFGVASCITVQMNYLNKALDIFNTSVVTPILYVIFTTFVLIAGAILFKEWHHLTSSDAVGLICGFLTVVCGIFLLQAFKDMNVSLNNLPSVRRTDPIPANNTNVNHTNVSLTESAQWSKYNSNIQNDKPLLNDNVATVKDANSHSVGIHGGDHYISTNT